MKRPGRKALMAAALEYQDALVAYAYGMLRDWGLAQDAVQEALLVLMEKWQEYRPELGLFPWFRKIVYLKVLEQSRSRKKELATEGEELGALVRQVVNDRFDEEAARRHRAMLRALQSCMSKLSGAVVDVLTAYYWDGKPCERIAAARRRSVAAIWHTLSRARSKLRNCVEHKLGGVEVAT